MCAGNPCNNDDLLTCCEPVATQLTTSQTPSPRQPCSMLVCPSGWIPKPGDNTCAANPCTQDDLETCCEQLVTTLAPVPTTESTAEPTTTTLAPAPTTTTPIPIPISTATQAVQTLAPATTTTEESSSSGASSSDLWWLWLLLGLLLLCCCLLACAGAAAAFFGKKKKTKRSAQQERDEPLRAMPPPVYAPTPEPQPLNVVEVQPEVPPIVPLAPAVEAVPTMVPIVQEVAVPTPTMVETAVPTMMSSTLASNPVFMTGGSTYPMASFGAPASAALGSYPAMAGYGYGGAYSSATMPAMGTTQGMMPQMAGMTLPQQRMF